MNILARLAMSVVALVLLALGPIGTAWAQVQVTSAEPTSTVQGTVSLDVTVTGNGFDSSAAVRFLVTGTNDTGGISVKKVSVRGSKKLVATIEVADTAVVTKFDIEVALSGGRKGKGTTLFTVIAKATGSLDPCAVPGLDFPAFTYWQQSGKGQQIFVADSTGTCSRSVYIKSDPMGGTVGAGSFSYPVAGTTNRGRVSYPDIGGIYAIDFTVNGTSIVVETPRWVLDTHHLSTDLSKDGKTIYFDGMPGSPTGASKVYALDIDSGVVTLLYTGDPDGTAFHTMSVNADGTSLFVGAQRAYDPHRLIRIDLPCVSSCATVVFSNQPGYAANAWPSVSFEIDPVLGQPLIAYMDFTGCEQLRIADFDGNVMFAGTQPRFGRKWTSWYGGKVLINGARPPDRRGICQETGYVTQVDPSTGAETQLVRGYDPDGR